MLEDHREIAPIENAYEEYVIKVLNIMRQKLDALIKFRIEIGKRKVEKLSQAREEA